MSCEDDGVIRPNGAPTRGSAVYNAKNEVGADRGSVEGCMNMDRIL